MKRTMTWLGMIFIPILLLLASPATLRAQFVYVANGGDITVSAYRIGGTIGSFGNLEAIGSFPAGNGHPLSVAVDPLNRFVYVGDDRDSVAAYRIEPTGALRLIRVSHTASPGTVNSVVVDPTGRFVYASLSGNLAGEVTVSAFRIGPTGALTLIGEQRFDSPPRPTGNDGFTVGLEFANELDRGEVSQALRQQFLSHSYALIPPIRVEVVRAGDRWKIFDANNTRVFSVVNAGVWLNVDLFLNAIPLHLASLSVFRPRV